MTPAISVIVPFKGSAAAAGRLLADLGRLAVRAGDEIVVVDNSPARVLDRLALPEGVRITAAPRLRSSYHARNRGVAAAGGEWLLFLDADCRPAADLLERYRRERLDDERCGAIGGAIVGVLGQAGLLASYARERRFVTHAGPRHHPYRPYAITANLLVRRRAWEAVGGFDEAVRSTGDADFCWRLQDAGWELRFADGPVIEHLHREHLAGLLRQVARYGAGLGWLERRHPGCPPHRAWKRSIARNMRDGLAAWARGRLRAGSAPLLDAVVELLQSAARGLPNRAAPLPGAEPATVVWAERFPRGHTQGAAFVEAARRDGCVHPGQVVRYAAEDALGERLAGLARLLVLRPASLLSADSRRLAAPAWRVSRLAPVAVAAADADSARAARELARLASRPGRTIAYRGMPAGPR